MLNPGLFLSIEITDKSTYQGYTGELFVKKGLLERKNTEILKGWPILKGFIPGVVYENICSVYLHHSFRIRLLMNIENIFGASVSTNGAAMNPDRW